MRSRLNMNPGDSDTVRTNIEKWKEYGKNRRTLMRYQKNALMKIQRFIREENAFLPED